MLLWQLGRVLDTEGGVHDTSTPAHAGRSPAAQLLRTHDSPLHPHRPRTAPPYGSLSAQGKQVIAAHGATVDLSDSANASSLQAIGTIRANAAQREADISQLEAATHSADPAQHTEMATLQRINQALLIELRTQQETNQMLQMQALQQMVGQKVQQDNLKSLFLVGNSYPQSFNSVTPQQTTAGTQWAFHY